MEKKVAKFSPAHCFPFSDSTPGGERVAVSRGGEGGTVRPTRTSPRRTPHPWGPLRAAGPPGGPATAQGRGHRTIVRAQRTSCGGRPIRASRHVGAPSSVRAKLMSDWLPNGPPNRCPQALRRTTLGPNLKLIVTIRLAESEPTYRR